MKRLITLFLAGFILLPSVAQAKSWSFDRWDVAVAVHADSSVTVREQQAFNFVGDFSWVTRDIPKDRIGDILNVQVFDETGRELVAPEVEIGETSDNVHIQINFSALNEKKVWTIQYDVLGGVGFFTDHDEFYWNAVSTDRDVPIDEVAVTVSLPQAPPVDEIRQRIFVGGTGSTDEVTSYSVLDDGTMLFVGQGIQPHENFTIVAGWPKGIVADPGTLQITASPNGQVVVDGLATDLETPAAIQLGPTLSAGEHTISVQRHGYRPEPPEQTVLLAAGETSSISFDLQETAWHAFFRRLGQLVAVALALSPLVVLVWLFRRWRRSGRDPKMPGTVIAHYEPPDNALPAVIGVLIDERADRQDITATIVDLAVRGYLRIVEERSGLLKRKSFRLEKRKSFEDSSLQTYERTLLNELFGGADAIDMKDLAGTFHQHIPLITKQMYEVSQTKGFFDDIPQRVRRRYAGLGVGLIIVGFMVIPLASFLSWLGGWMSFALIVNGILFLIFAPTMPRRTVKGVQALWQTKGFKLYLEKAERFRLKAMTPETFERFLPYAMILGVEKQWAERFHDIYQQPPSWYVSSQPFTAGFLAGSLTSSLNSFSTYTRSSAMAAPASSGSGFGGGGFSGGGGGGGGSGAG